MPAARVQEESLCSAVGAVAAGDGLETAVMQGCAAVAGRMGLQLPRLWRRAAAPGIQAAVERLSEAALRDPARTLGEVHEQLLQGQVCRGKAHARRRTGSYYTPQPLVRYVLETTLSPALQSQQGNGIPSVLDPACGSGVFLVEALRRLLERRGAGLGRSRGEREYTAVAECVHGIDLSGAAVRLARFSLWLACGGRVPMEVFERTVRMGDALLEPPAQMHEVVVGNPPFLNQLETATAHSRRRAAKLAERYGEIARCYADSACIFLEMGLRAAKPGGRVAMVQPQSILASRDALPVRESVLRRGRMTHLWIAREQIFTAHVLVCVPTIHVGAQVAPALSRSMGSDFRALPAVRQPETSTTWAPLMADAHGIPSFSLQTSRTLGELATATADFRDQFYGLRGRIVESEALPAGADPGHYPPLVTTGLVDPACCRWGVAPTRIDKRQWRRPRLELQLLEQDPELARWARARLVAKILLATQTKVLEAAVDERGEWIPVTPLITIVPRTGEDIWHAAAALLSPVLSAWSLMHFAGAGLSASAIKLSAKQALGLPIPARCGDWDRAAKLVRTASRAKADGREGLLVDAGRLMCSAYGLDAATSDELISWWRCRFPRRPRESAPVQAASASAS